MSTPNNPYADVDILAGIDVVQVSAELRASILSRLAKRPSVTELFEQIAAELGDDPDKWEEIIRLGTLAGQSRDEGNSVASQQIRP